ncbi:MAG: PAS domain S-box protein [Ectothiorhodospiraceae bacterium]|nr:PAS domain S-box protein [Chromatiales bacterium]MCP5156775.1 PAS domain S-box protein [Ectothiorhodospiraceae bacterium]
MTPTPARHPPVPTAPEDRFDVLFERNPDPCSIIDPGGTFVRWNRAAAQMLGYDDVATLGAVHPSVLSPPTQADGHDSRTKADEMIARAHREGVHRFEWRHLRRSGEVFPVEVTLTRIEWDGVAHLYCVWRDLTESKRAQAALEASEAMHRRAQRIAALGHWERGLVADTFLWSDETYRIFGVDPDCGETPERVFRRVVHPDDRDWMEAAYDRAVAEHTPYDVEHRLLLPDGTEKWVHERGETTYGEDGTPLATAGTVLDITARKQVEGRLRASEERFQLAMEGANEGLWDWDLTTDAVYYSPRWLGMLGYAADALPATLDTWGSLVHDDDRARVLARVEDYLAGRADGFEVEMRMRHRDGHDVMVRSRALKIVDPTTGAARRLIGTHDDITARKNAERRVLESEQSYRGILDSLNEAVYVLDGDGRVLDANAGAQRLHGTTREQAIGRPAPFVPARGDAAAPADATLRDALALAMKGVAVPLDARGARAGTESFPEEVHLYPGTYFGARVVIAVGIDVSERRLLEQRLLQSQKMEAVGRLVGGIAHDFNNFLAAIQGNVHLARLRVTDPAAVTAKMAIVDELVSRAARMVQQLLTFSRQSTVHLESVSMNELAREGMRLADAAIPASITRRAEICDESLAVLADSTQIQQVIMNLVNNAVDAVEGRPDPTIVVRLTSHTADAAFLARHPGIAAGRHARLTVADNGEGIAEPDRHKLFEPFFTTKPVGRGTGLGLAMVFGAVQHHGGAIEVESERGRGTEMHVYLPLTTDPGTRDAPTPARGHVGRGETVLVVDDDDAVRAMTCEMLSGRNYRVLEARDGLDALARLAAPESRVDLTVSDVVMPKMGGVELLEAVRASAPSHPMVLVTGYDRHRVLDNRDEIPRCRVLAKPFDCDELCASIEALLAADDGA